MSRTVNVTKKFLCFLLVVAAISCAKSAKDKAASSESSIDSFDENTGLSFSEIEKGIIKSKDKKGSKAKSEASPEAPIPNSSKLIFTPPPPVIGGDKIISFSVTDQVSLKDVLIELGRVANIDIDLDPSISGGIIINAKNRPLKEVIDRISTLGQLRYSYKNGVLYFERDTPYMKNYFVDYLTDGTLWTDVETNIKSLLKSSDESAASTASATSNKSAGIIAVYGTDKQQSAIAKYLTDVQKYASAQVLIEAKVVEVTLNKDFASGIDWSWTGKNNTSGSPSIKTQGTFGVGELTTPALIGGISDLKLFGLNGNIAATIKALARFGNAKAISSPRITAMNNQKASLDFSESLVYFTVTTSSSTASGGNSAPVTVAAVSATKTEIPIGVQLAITPSINLATNEITLDIQPKLSVDSGKVATDPTTDPISHLNLGNKVPIVKTRTLKTLAKIESGNVLVIGGLMSETTANKDVGVPFLSKIPILGYLFRYSSRATEVVETVIFIKATIVGSGAIVGKEDRDIQQKFDVNRRQFFN